MFVERSCHYTNESVKLYKNHCAQQLGRTLNTIYTSMNHKV